MGRSGQGAQTGLVAQLHLKQSLFDVCVRRCIGPAGGHNEPKRRAALASLTRVGSSIPVRVTRVGLESMHVDV